MRRSGRLALAFALSVAAAIVALGGTISDGDRTGLEVNELLRVEPVPADSSSPLDDHLDWVLGISDGTRPATEADVANRFAPGLRSLITAEALNSLVQAEFAVHGTVRFVRVVERRPQLVQALLVAENGSVAPTYLHLADDDRIDFVSSFVDLAGPRRLPSWESTLVLVAGLALLAAAAAAWRGRTPFVVWALLAASMPTLAGLLILSDSRIAYTAGRALPLLVVVPAVVLLATPNAGWPTRWLTATAVVAAVLGALAPFVRDAVLIGHPPVIGAFADSAALYRVLLTSSAGLTVLAMVGVAAMNIGSIDETSTRMRPAVLAATCIAAVWALTAFGAAIDYGIGNGSLAEGPLSAITLSLLAITAALVIFRLVISDDVAQHTGRFAMALALGAVLAVVAVGGAISRQDRNGLSIGELLRIESLPADPSSPLDEHMQWLFEISDGTRQATEADFGERADPGLAARITADQIQTAANEIFTTHGTVRFVRVTERQPSLLRALGVAENGTPLENGVETGVDGKRISTLALGLVDLIEPRRLPGWEATLLLVAGWVLLATAAAAWRYRWLTEAWMLLVASIPTLAGLLILSDSRVAYTAGRLIPALIVVLAVALLAGRPTRWVSAAVAAAVLAAIAPFARDAVLIGHPPLIGAFADSGALYRLLLTSSAALTALAMGGVAALNTASIGRASKQMRPALVAATSIAVLWALAALGKAVDYGIGNGTLATGPLQAITLSALVVTPALVVFRLLMSSWDHLELAALVIDLESEGSDLRPAIAKALEDPTIEVLTSPDGQVLLSDSGDEVSPEEVPEGRALTRIQSGPHLVGGLVHQAVLKRSPARIEAVAAAAGMALDVSRLNQQVRAQLAEVEASRARILQASDTARRQVERDLHDGAQQRLVAVGLRLQRALRQADSEDRDQLARLLHDATSEVRDTIEEIRAVSRGRQPALLAERGLATAVDALAERAPVPVHIDITAGHLPAPAEMTAYYVIAEGLTNLAKHAEATEAHVSISRPNGVACITIRDDGNGGAKITAGSGLEGLSDRLAATGGTFNISSGPGGTTLEANIPCE